MQVFKTPGVYVQEISTLPASIAPVATAVPSFLGYTEMASDNGGVDQNLINVPTRVTSLAEYEQIFGGAYDEADLEVTFNDTVDSDDVLLSRNVTVAFETGAGKGRSQFRMYYAMQMYFANGGGPCWICSVGLYIDPDTSMLNTVSAGDYHGAGKGLNEVAKVDEVTLLVVPEAVVLAGDGSTYDQYDTVMGKCLEQCKTLQDRFTIYDVVQLNGTIANDQNSFRNNGVGTDYLNYGSAYYPYLTTSLAYAYDDADVNIVHKVTKGGVTTVGTFAAGPDLASMLDPDTGEEAQTEVYNQASAALANFRVEMPPSSSMAGIYARVDRDRGVWKAPANVSVSNVVGPAIPITAAEQEDLNVDVTAGKSINAIRSFTGKGTLVWGARTLAGNDNEWRYVNVRRLFIFLEESISKATEAVVFESNDSRTWLRLKSQIESFLNQQWSAGALAGSTAEQAYFVNVGLGSTMTSTDILEGRMIVDIGIAAVRPAEFIILRFTHKLQES